MKRVFGVSHALMVGVGVLSAIAAYQQQPEARVFATIGIVAAVALAAGAEE